jgi:hypothetical protein
MTPQRKQEHIRNIAFCIKHGATGYATANFTIGDLPTPQRAGTLTQQDAYARGKAQIIFEEFLKQNPEIDD